MKRNLRLAIVAAIIAVLVGAGLMFTIGPWRGTMTKSSGSNSGGKQPFDIGMVTFAGYAPLYLAKEKRFFGDLDVRLQRIEEVSSIRAGMATGELEAYLATPDIALDTNSKPPGVAVWAIDESAGGDGVVVSGDVKELSDLRGRKVAAEPGLPPNFLLLYFLHQNGMALSDISFQDMTTQNAATAFVSRAVDAAGIYEPYLTTAKDQRPGSRVVISSAQVPGLIVDLIFVGDRVATERRADVMKVIAGWRKALAYIRESPDDANAIMAKAFNLAVKEFKETVGGIIWLDLDKNRLLFGTSSDPGPLYKNFDVVGGVLRRNRPAVYRAKAEEHLTRSFIDELNKGEVGHHEPKRVALAVPVP